MQTSLWCQAEHEARGAVESSLKGDATRPVTYAAHPAYLPCVRKALSLMSSMPNPMERATALGLFASGVSRA